MSNSGKLFALLVANHLTSYMKLPATLMTVIQASAEDIWLKLMEFDCTTLSFTTVYDMYNGVQLPSFVSKKLLLMCFLLTVFWYTYQKIYAYICGIDNYYICMLKNFWYNKIRKVYCGEIDLQTQLFYINSYMVEEKVFIVPYDNIRHFQYSFEQYTSSQTHQDFTTYKKLVIPKLDTRYYFNDTRFNVSGYITWRTTIISIMCEDVVVGTVAGGTATNTKTNVVRQCYVPKMYMCISIPPDEYYAKIQTHNRKLPTSTARYYCDIKKDKIFSKAISRYIVQGDETAYFREHYAKDLEEKYIDTYFNPCKHSIWPKLKAIAYDPDDISSLGQYPQASYCMYGPPGTGKSTLAYRVARALGRGLVSIDIRGIETTHELSRILSGTTLKTAAGSSISTVNTDPRQCVFVLDEFDKAIMALKAKSNLKVEYESRRMKTVNKYFSRKHRSSDSSDSESASEDDTNDTGPALTPEQEENIKYLRGQGYVINPKKKEHTKKHKKGHERHENNAVEIKKSIADMNGVDDELTIDSLLGIIQGPCANNGLIIFATTNKYKEIRDICPRLFRDGRFKPVYCGYPSRETINDMTMHYYKKCIMGEEYNYIPDLVRIPLSRLTARVVDARYQYSGEDANAQAFGYFMQHLKHDIEHYRLSKKFENYEQELESELYSNGSVSLPEDILP